MSKPCGEGFRIGGKNHKTLTQAAITYCIESARVHEEFNSNGNEARLSLVDKWYFDILYKQKFDVRRVPPYSTFHEVPCTFDKGLQPFGVTFRRTWPILENAQSWVRTFCRSFSTTTLRQTTRDEGNDWHNPKTNAIQCFLGTKTDDTLGSIDGRFPCFF